MAELAQGFLLGCIFMMALGLAVFYFTVRK